jgi:hypothetical protein
VGVHQKRKVGERIAVLAAEIAGAKTGSDETA